MAAAYFVAAMRALKTSGDQDYTLTCGGQTFKVHSLVLSARSLLTELDKFMMNA
jgi:hypothetical protein